MAPGPSGPLSKAPLPRGLTRPLPSPTFTQPRAKPLHNHDTDLIASRRLCTLRAFVNAASDTC